MNDIDFIANCARILNEQAEFTGKIEEAEHSMVGPAGAAKYGTIDEIADIREKLANGVVEFEFWKINKETNQHELRHAVGTTSDKVVPITDRVHCQPTYMQDVAKMEQRSGYIVWYWDLEKNQLRCFNTNRFDNIVKYTPTTQKIGAGVTKVGNIFIHKDIDPNMDKPSQQTVAEVNTTLTQQFQAGGDIYQALQSDPLIQTAAAIIPTEAAIETDTDGSAVLHMVIAKNANDDDPPYQLAMNVIRKQIQETYGIAVKKVTVEGTFVYA